MLIPYIKNKNDVMKLGLEFADTISSNKKKLTDEIKEKRASIKERIMILNAKD